MPWQGGGGAQADRVFIVDEGVTTRRQAFELRRRVQSRKFCLFLGSTHREAGLAYWSGLQMHSPGPVGEARWQVLESLFGVGRRVRVLVVTQMSMSLMLTNVLGT